MPILPGTESRLIENETRDNKAKVAVCAWYPLKILARLLSVLSKFIFTCAIEYFKESSTKTEVGSVSKWKL